MNCTTCQYELSQCLDGRLPSGRRALVMAHVADCADCARFWAEVQAVQQMTLQLPRIRVSDGFRAQLWERIHAGEGTPEAVFRDPVPTWTKVRYLLAGAAAAAVLLVSTTWLRRPEPAGTDRSTAPLASAGAAAERLGATDPLHPRERAPQGSFAVASAMPDVGSMPFAGPSMLASAQRLTADAVAVEAARQFEQRYSDAARNLGRLSADTEDDPAVGRLLDQANELHVFAEVLLDLRDNDRVSFRDAEVGADLRLAANLLGQSRLQKRSVDTVRSFVAPALQQSDRLGHLARLIRVRPSFDPIEERAEQELLRRLSTQRPEVLSKLFFFLPDRGPDALLDLMPNGDVFVLEDQCGPSLVAPRSRVEEGNHRYQMWVQSTGGDGRQVHVQIQVGGQR